MFDHFGKIPSISYPGVAQLVGRLVWDQDAASSSLATRTISVRNHGYNGCVRRFSFIDERYHNMGIFTTFLPFSSDLVANEDGFLLYVAFIRQVYVLSVHKSLDLWIIVFFLGYR